jgi:hypothetical protein
MTASLRRIAAIFSAFALLALLGALADHFFVTRAPWLRAVRISTLYVAAAIALSYVLYELLPRLLRWGLAWLERP